MFPLPQSIQGDPGAGVGLATTGDKDGASGIAPGGKEGDRVVCREDGAIVGPEVKIVPLTVVH